jgi:hypothetical protein
MGKVTQSQFLDDVRHEVESLKRLATTEELSLLNLVGFNPNRKHSCIYGQITGDCCSIRAKELMDASCVRVFNGIGGTRKLSRMSLDYIISFVNGVYNRQTWCVNNTRNFTYLSALEGYICSADANISGIISYLKGETDTLVL